VRTVYSLETFLVALVFCAVYAVAGRLQVLQRQFPRRWLSLAAGVSVAYVFVDILPELGARHRGFVEAAGQELLFAEQRIYLGALLGFLFFYGLEHLVFASRVPDAPQDGTETNRAAFRLHIGGYALYSWLIGYLLMSRAIRGGLSLGLYAAAMALHFAVVGNALVREHGHAYRRRGRWLLAASVLAGWLTSATAPMADAVISRLFAFVAGGVVMTSMNEELPREREGRFWWFVLGAAGYAIILLMV
jgi:hypothetical protein